jgi:hypothetical protein
VDGVRHADLRADERERDGFRRELRGRVDGAHEQQLTRDEITASVHYLRWEHTPDQVAAFAAGPVELVADRAAYAAATPPSDATHAELVGDLVGGG